MADRTRDRTDIVPLRDRLQQLQLFRLVMVAGLVVALATGAVSSQRPALVFVGLVAFSVVTTIVVLAWERGGWRRIPVLAGLLITDGVALAAVRLVIDDPSGTITYLPVLHVVMTTLLGSYPTGWKLATWHTLLYFTGAEAVTAGMLPTLGLAQDAVAAPLVLMWGAMVVTASSSSLNERELRRQRADLEALATFSSSIQEVVAPDEIAEALRDAMRDIAEVAEVVLIDVDANGVLAGPGDLGEEDPMSAELVATAAHSAERQLVRGLDVARDGWLTRLLPDVKNVAVLPGTAEGVTLLVAVLPDVAADGSRVQRRVIASLERVLSYGTMAFRNARLRDDLAARAATDGLTGIPNRASLDQHLEQELARADRTSAPLAVAMIDVDHFKQFNDTHGHLLGDEALQAVARELEGASRGYDFVARFGGEEFAAVLPHTDLETAATVAERLRLAVEAIPDLSQGVTASIGVASSQDHATVEDLLEAADAALYRAKRTGRNRVVVDQRLRGVR